MRMLRGFLICLQFLTSIPVNKSLPMDKIHIEKTIQCFPLLGLLQGALYSSLFYVLMEWTPFSPLAIAFSVWLSTVIITGGIHLDGWMDVSDSYFSYQDKDKRLEIMKDPRMGAFGALSVIVLLSARFLFIYEITIFGSVASFFLMLLIPFMSKVVMGMVLLKVPAAKQDGLASFFKKAGSASTLRIYPVYIVLLLGFISFVDTRFIFPALTMILIAFGCYFFIRKKSVTWFGGITGDVLGASVEGTENILWMTLWLLHYFVMG